METLLLILWLLLAVSLLVIVAMKPKRTRQSRFEMERQNAKAVLRRERLLGGVFILLWLMSGLLIILLTYLGFLMWQGWGVFMTMVLLVAVVLLSRIGIVKNRSMRLYNSQEERLLRAVEKIKLVKWLTRSQNETHTDQKIESTEHLVHLVESAGNILSREQQNLIKRGLRWHGMEVRKVMTPAEEIVSVRRSELLGPLVLDDLHKSGHHLFPVVGSGLDHVLGQIDIANMLEIDANKKTQTAEYMMTTLDVRLHEDTTLPEALRQLMDHPNQLGLVIDNDDKTVGLVSLSDVLRALLG